MRAFSISLKLSLLLALACVPLFAAPAAPAAAPVAILPAAFAGFEQSGKPELGTDPRKLDATSAAVLAEDRFVSYQVATYKSQERTLIVRAARFADAEGAYAAFTYYRQPLMRPEQVGVAAASLNERVLFFVSNILVDVQFDHITAMSGSQLRELAGLLPAAKGPTAELPTLPNYLPRKPLVPQTARYLIGPAAFAALNADVPASVINFNKNPQILWAHINGNAPGSAQLLLVAYPTPAIAMEQLPAMQQLAPPADAGALSVAKRTGPILALVRGNISRSDAARVLGAVNYDAEVTWTENTGLSKHDNIGSLVVAALTLAFILVIVSLGAGAMFGFGRFFLPRLWGKTRGQPVDDGAMIRLDLDHREQAKK